MTPATDSSTAAVHDDRPSFRGKARYLLLSLAVLAVDQATKWWVEEALAPHRPLEVIAGFLNFTHVRNTGVAFGLFAGSGEGIGPVVLSLLGFAALALVGHYFRQAPVDEPWLLAGLACILGGAVGNLLDRLVSGGVTDFIDAYVGSYHWHTFNVADSAITVGVGLMLVDFLRRRDRRPAEAEG